MPTGIYVLHMDVNIWPKLHPKRTIPSCNFFSFTVCTQPFNMHKIHSRNNGVFSETPSTHAGSFYFRMTKSGKLRQTVCDGPCEWNAQPLPQNVDKGLFRFTERNEYVHNRKLTEMWFWVYQQQRACDGSSPWGDFLRSVPCVTVWHQKIKFYSVSARKKSIKTHLVYVPMITKNCRGHLPDLSYLDTRIVHVTQWRFWENMVV